MNPDRQYSRNPFCVDYTTFLSAELPKDAINGMNAYVKSITVGCSEEHLRDHRRRRINGHISNITTVPVFPYALRNSSGI
jgi:hypothetical protein